MFILYFKIEWAEFLFDFLIEVRSIICQLFELKVYLMMDMTLIIY